MDHQIDHSIESKILLIRRRKVILGMELGPLYGVSVFNLNKAVRRNPDRFPSDFVFQLTTREWRDLKFQFGISSSQWGGARQPPYAFTEEGVAMLSSVLRSRRATQVNVTIMRAFVKLRRLLSSHADLARKLNALEKRYDGRFKLVFDAIRRLEEFQPEKDPPLAPRQAIGFKPEEKQ